MFENKKLRFLSDFNFPISLLETEIEYFVSYCMQKHGAVMHFNAFWHIKTQHPNFSFPY